MEGVLETPVVCDEVLEDVELAVVVEVEGVSETVVVDVRTLVMVVALVVVLVPPVMGDNKA
jgi:hypothetical protein